MALLNDPYRGGTHLPDITMVAPVFVRGQRRPAFYVANRAHHADVGGMHPGSMGPCREIAQEGIRIPPVMLMRAGQMDTQVFEILLANVRTPREREGDLTAQLGPAASALHACMSWCSASAMRACCVECTP